MAEFFGTLFAGVGLAILVAGAIAIIRPLPAFRISTRTRAVVVASAGLILMVSGGALLPDEAPSSPGSPSIAKDSPKPTTRITIGQPIDQDGYRLVVTRVMERDVVGDSFMSEAAASGGVLIVVEYTLENRTNQPMGAFDFPTPVLIDAKGVVYKPDLGKTGAYTFDGPFDRKLASDLNPGIKVKDAQVFEVSRQTFDPATWQVSFDGSRVSLAEAGVELTAENLTSNCNTRTPAAERVMCENPDLLRRNDAVAERLTTFLKNRPRDPRKKQFVDAVHALFKTCGTRDCVDRWTSQWEQIADDWGA